MWAITRCCYTTVEFATAASQNDGCITQQICHKVKDESKKSLMFCLILNNMDVLMKGKFILYVLYTSIVMQLWQNQPLCSSTDNLIITLPNVCTTTVHGSTLKKTRHVRVITITPLVKFLVSD